MLYSIYVNVQARVAVHPFYCQQLLTVTDNQTQIQCVFIDWAKRGWFLFQFSAQMDNCSISHCTTHFGTNWDRHQSTNIFNMEILRRSSWFRNILDVEHKILASDSDFHRPTHRKRIESGKVQRMEIALCGQSNIETIIQTIHWWSWVDVPM